MISQVCLILILFTRFILVVSQCPIVPPKGCSICGDGQCVGNPNAILSSPEELNGVVCAQLQDAGYSAKIPLDQCPALIDYIKVCECGAGYSSTSPPSSEIETTSNPVTTTPVTLPVEEDSPNPTSEPVVVITVSPSVFPVTDSPSIQLTTLEPVTPQPVIITATPTFTEHPIFRVITFGETNIPVATTSTFGADISLKKLGKKGTNKGKKNPLITMNEERDAGENKQRQDGGKKKGKKDKKMKGKMDGMKGKKNNPPVDTTSPSRTTQEASPPPSLTPVAATPPPTTTPLAVTPTTSQEDDVFIPIQSDTPNTITPDTESPNTVPPVSNTDVPVTDSPTTVPPINSTPTDTPSDSSFVTDAAMVTEGPV
jgi:hypothetical protein